MILESSGGPELGCGGQEDGKRGSGSGRLSDYWTLASGAGRMAKAQVRLEMSKQDDMQEMRSGNSLMKAQRL